MTKAAAAALACALLVPVAPLIAQAPSHPPLTVSGTVVQENGAQAAGVDIALRPYPTVWEIGLSNLNGPEALPEAVDGARVGADGSFQLVAPEVWPYRLEVRLANEADAPPVAVPVLYCSLVPLSAPVVLGDLELPDLHRLTIRAEDAAGNSVPGALVVAEAVGEMPPSDACFEPRRFGWFRRFGSEVEQQALDLSFGRASAWTDAEGVARFLMPATRSNVVVSAPGYALNGDTVDSGSASIRLEPAVETVFRARTPAGDAAPGVLAALGAGRGAPVAWTDEQGEAVLGLASGHETTLGFEAADHASATVSVRSDDTSERRIVDVPLEPVAVASGRVFDEETGEAIAGAVAWTAADPGRAARADRFGVFDALAPGGGNVGVAAAGYLPATVRPGATQAPNGAPLSIGLRPAAPLWGRVVDGLGQAISGANVRARPLGLGMEATATGSDRDGGAISGFDGSFWIGTAIYGSPYRVTVEAAGHASLSRELPAMERGGHAGPVTLVLTKGRQPWGTVLSSTGAPVAGAEVRLLWPPEHSQLEASRFAVEATDSVVSNGRGEFEFPHVALGAYGVRIVHSEHVDLRWQGVDVPQGEGYADLGIFTLAPGAEIVGTVTGPDRRPVGGAAVSAEQRGRTLFSKQSRSALTDRDGNFRLTGLLPGLADLEVTAKGYASQDIRDVRPATGEPVLVELSRGASVAGTVRSAAGDAAAGAGVSLSNIEMLRRRMPVSMRFHHVETDGDGQFRFTNLIPGVWTVEAKDDQGGTATENIELLSGQQEEIELRLRESDRLIVRVTTRQDQPVARAEVWFDPQGDGGGSAWGSTDASGRANLEVVAGAATVEVSHPRLLAASRDVVIERGVNELHVQLDTGWEISGVVRAVDGAPIAGATVEAGPDRVGGFFKADSEKVARINAIERWLDDSTPRTTSGVGGSFRLTGLDRGHYYVMARRPGYSQGALDPVEIDDRSVSGVVIELASEISIRGTVTGVEPAEMANVEIRAWQGMQFRNASPDFEGAFHMEGLAPGEWRILAVTRDERRSAESVVQLGPGGGNRFVELRFEPGLRLSGQVLVAGAPVSGGFVRVTSLDETMQRRTRTDSLGRFEITGLPAGPYVASARHRSGTTAELSLDLQGDRHDLLFDLQPAQAPEQ